MRVLVTGAAGFAGRWLLRELDATGHDAIGTPPSSEFDVRDQRAVAEAVAQARPDAIAHLAAVSFGPDARDDPAKALAVNEGGTRSVLAAAVAGPKRIPVLVVSSSDVYGNPDPSDLPLTETAPLRATTPYGLSKVAQERVASEFAAVEGVPIAIARSFNHTGPGQRAEFVIPALAARTVAAIAAGGYSIKAGNVDVQRDFSDVRDVVRAYRLLLEALSDSRLSSNPDVYNVASGRSVAIRAVIDSFAGIVGIDLAIDVDQSLVRHGDPAEIRGDASRLARLLGWTPSIPLDVTLRDVLADAASRAREADRIGSPQPKP